MKKSLSFYQIEPNNWVFHDSKITTTMSDSFFEALDLWGHGNIEKAEIILRRLIKKHPEYIDAIHHLSIILEETGKAYESLLLNEKAVLIGLSVIPEHFSWIIEKVEWGFTSNRPFMRAYYVQGCKNYKHGNALLAIRNFARLNNVCHNDNLGARFVLMHSLLDVSYFKEAIKLADKYDDEISPDMSFGKAIAYFKNNEPDKGIESLKYAVSNNKRVAFEILKDNHIKPISILPNSITIGGEDEAFYYWDKYKSYWTKETDQYQALKNIIEQKG